ncbi:unnamed protein product [Adineta ricciae]|uniref:Uncharacterized protein n=1 Tax=Adineta ricciae TaxID=249248 RepID=A0A815L4K3_ADIRI|nr:unnamed protein product [Adineta ricciae]
MVHNKINIGHLEPVDSITIKTTNIQSRVLCIHYRSKKSIWAICLIIFAILILSGVIIAKTIFTKRTQNSQKKISTTMTTTTTTGRVNTNTKWKQNGITIVGGRGKGNELDQLDNPKGIDIDDDGSVYIADENNHRIVRWISDAKNGEVVAGGNDSGDRIDQLFFPIEVVIDKKNNSLIICDTGNHRVVEWSLTYPQNPQILISKIVCDGLAIDNNGELYISEWINNKIIRLQQGAKQGVVVIGENGVGDDFNQLSSPGNLVVDQDYSIYVSDRKNHRVMKWLKGAKQGIVVAGGHSMGNNFNQLAYPKGLIVDHLGNVYVADPSL